MTDEIITYLYEGRKYSNADSNDIYTKIGRAFLNITSSGLYNSGRGDKICIYGGIFGNDANRETINDAINYYISDIVSGWDKNLFVIAGNLYYNTVYMDADMTDEEAVKQKIKGYTAYRFNPETWSLEEVK